MSEFDAVTIGCGEEDIDGLCRGKLGMALRASAVSTHEKRWVNMHTKPCVKTVESLEDKVGDCHITKPWGFAKYRLQPLGSDAITLRV